MLARAIKSTIVIDRSASPSNTFPVSENLLLQKLALQLERLSNRLKCLSIQAAKLIILSDLYSHSISEYARDCVDTLLDLVKRCEIAEAYLKKYRADSDIILYRTAAQLLTIYKSITPPAPPKHCGGNGPYADVPRAESREFISQFLRLIEPTYRRGLDDALRHIRMVP